MIEKTGDIWAVQSAVNDAGGDAVVVVTTNGAVRRDGACVMGRGIARQAARRNPTLPYSLGAHIENNGNVPYFATALGIATLPVKHHWSEDADLELIRCSVEEFARKAKVYDGLGITWLLVRPGCGNGGLDWADVKPVIEPYLPGDEFIIVDDGSGDRR